MTVLVRGVLEALGAVVKVAERMAAIGVLVAATWDDDDPVPHDPLLSG